MEILYARFSANRPLYWLALGLTALLVVYMGVWLNAVIIVLATDRPSGFFGINLREVLRHTTRLDLALFFGVATTFFATLILLGWRRAASAVTLGAGILLHLALWFRLTMNPIYDASVGMLVIAFEVIILLMILRLRQIAASH